MRNTNYPPCPQGGSSSEFSSCFSAPHFLDFHSDPPPSVNNALYSADEASFLWYTPSLPDSRFRSRQGYAARSRRPAVIDGLAPLRGSSGGPSPVCGTTRRGPWTFGRTSSDGAKEKHFAYGKPAGYFKTSGVSRECSLAAEVGSNYYYTHPPFSR